jgi:SAM-dependent methyltransferase
MIPTMTADESEAWRPEIKGWSRDILPMYREWAKEIPDGGLVVEIGVFNGRSLLFLAQELLRLGKNHCALWGIDPTRYPEFWVHYTRTLGARCKIHMIQGWSAEESFKFPDRSADLVFIDGGHSEQSVREDILAYSRIVKHDGILAGHDYDRGDEHPGVKRAVDALLGDVEHFDFVWWRRMP